MKRPWCFGLLLFVVSCGIAPPARARQEIANQADRLILKDGSHESISRYAIEGDRVRYYSTERFAWEELPNALIDWDATKKYADRAAQDANESRSHALEIAARERAEEEARLPWVAPGIRVPAPEGVFLLNLYQGKPEWNRLRQSGGDLNKNTGGNILRGILNPVAGSKQTVEVPGLRASIQAHATEPVLYFGIDPADTAMGYNSETAKDHLKIVRCKTKKGFRVVATIEIAVYGKVRQKAQHIETRVERVSDYWVKVIPLAPMQPGEYALVEYDAKGSLNQFVWDFGVDPSAPPNPATPVGDPERKEPVLIQKPRKSEAP